MCRFTPEDYNKAWRCGNVQQCKIVGTELLEYIMKSGPVDARWRNQFKSLISKLNKVKDNNPTALILDQVRLIIQVNWVN